MDAARNAYLTGHTTSPDFPTTPGAFQRTYGGSDTQPVFDTIVRSAVNLCDGVFSAVALFDGELLHLAAHHNYTPDGARLAQQMYPRRPDRLQMLGRAVLEGVPVQVEDALADPEYAHDLARAGTWRGLLGVPMLRDGRPIGAIASCAGSRVPSPRPRSSCLKLSPIRR